MAWTRENYQIQDNTNQLLIAGVIVIQMIGTNAAMRWDFPAWPGDILAISLSLAWLARSILKDRKFERSAPPTQEQSNAKRKLNNFSRVFYCFAALIVAGLLADLFSVIPDWPLKKGQTVAIAPFVMLAVIVWGVMYTRARWRFLDTLPYAAPAQQQAPPPR